MKVLAERHRRLPTAPGILGGGCDAAGDVGIAPKGLTGQPSEPRPCHPRWRWASSIRILRWIPMVALLVAAAPPQDPAAAAKGAAVAPFVGEEVAALAHIDLMKVDAPALARRLLGNAAEAEANREEDVHNAARAVGGIVDALRKAGAKDLYVLLDPTDLPGVPVLVVPLAAGADANAISGTLSGGQLRGFLRGAATATIRGAVVAASPDALARLRDAAPAPRPGLADALAAGGDAAVQVVVIPTEPQRRALEESMTTLPPQLGGAPITVLTRGLRWASLALRVEPRPALGVVLQAKDEDAAKALQRVLATARDLVADETRKDRELTELAQAVQQIEPQAQADRVVLEADLEKNAALFALPIRKARESALRAQCVNNVKQIALAMHNYHSANNSFPPAYSASKDGKPLLSWRVHILPFLDRKGLYDRFHLDEPWDSPHNRELIAQMPPVYACPSGSRKLAREGKTSYLTPRGPSTMFPGADPVPIKDITDGTSNTVLVVDASDALAVIWTKPDDWEVGPEPSGEGLFGHHPRGTNFGFADGSVKFLKQNLSPKLLKALLTRNGGEVISADDY